MGNAATRPASEAPTIGLQPRSAFALPERFGKFRILREIGRGGMGVVYEAEDTVMVRTVALKTLFARKEDHESEDRFRREAQIAGTLDHPNLVLVYDFGTLDGIPYYTMPLVHGLSLDEVIERLHGRARGERPAFLEIPSDPVARTRLVLEWFEGALMGLDHAHRKGIVHRDLKPSNLILDAASGRLRIADFGLARARHLAGLTRQESLIGTVAYMSPEQVGRATMQVDLRSDIYSMGVTLYRTLYDRLPYTADTTAGYIQKIISVAPALRGDGVARLPADLQTILGKSLDKSPAHRYGSAEEFAEDLGRFRRYEPIMAHPVGPTGRLARWVHRKPGIAILLSLLLVALIVSGGLYRAHIESSRLMRASQVASLVKDGGFTAAAGDHAKATSLYTQALLMDPANFDALIGRAMSRTEIPGETPEALNDLEAAARIGPRLSSIHMIRSLLLRRLGDADGAQREEKAFLATPPRIALDFRLLGDTLSARGDCKAAIEPYTRAEQIAPQDFWAILRRGICRAEAEDLVGTRIDYEIVAHLVPDHASAHNNLGDILWRQGELVRARQESLKALEIDPNHAMAHNNLGQIAYTEKNLGEAELHYRKALSIEPQLRRARVSLGVVLLETKRQDEGVAMIEKVIGEDSGRSELFDNEILSKAHTNLCDVYLGRRDTRTAAEHCEEAVRLLPNNPVAHYNLAAYRMLTGDQRGALASLERDADLGDTDVDYLMNDPVFSPLRSELRFVALVERMRRKARRDD